MNISSLLSPSCFANCVYFVCLLIICPLLSLYSFFHLRLLAPTHLTFFSHVKCEPSLIHTANCLTFRLVQFPYLTSFSPDLLRISVNLPFSLELFFLSVQTQCFLCLPCILPLLIFFFLHVDWRPSSIHTANLS